MQILLIGICVITLIAIWLGYTWLSKPDDTFEIKLSKGYTQSVDFGSLDLIPGQSKQYDIDLSSTISGEIDLEFTFEELSASPLAEYIYFEIKIGDEVLCDTRLDNLLDGRCLTHTLDMKISETTRVDVRCYMPSSVGNDAQGKTADVRLNIGASSERPLGE